MAVWTEPQLIEMYLSRRIDSEFFDPAYGMAESKTQQCQTENLGRLGNFIPGPFGSAFHAQNYDFKSSYRYIRGRDVKPFFLLDDDSRYVPENDFNRLEKYSVLPQDLMISVVGTLGNVSICTEDDTPAIFSCKSTVFRSGKIDPYYLLAYLNCHYGKMCLLRRQRGAVQTGLNIEDLRSIPIPRFGESVEKQISSFVQASHFAAKQAKASYAQAEYLFNSKLGLDKLRFDKPVGYTAQFSALELARRADADFFSPMLRYYYKALSEGCPLRPLTDFASVLKFSNPPYAEKGLPIITQKHLGKISPNNYGADLVAAKEWLKANPLALIRNYDLLYYSVGAYLGKTNIWLSNSEAVHASFITMLRCHDIKNSGFLQVMLNSNCGILQSKCFQSGTSQPYIYPKDIRKFLIPDVNATIRQRIHDLVVKSYQKNEEAKQLLEQAKNRVEQLIEGAVQA